MPQAAGVVDYICQKKGGEGAVREIVEMILAAQHKSVKATGGKRQ